VKLSIEEFEKQLVYGLRKNVPGGDLEIHNLKRQATGPCHSQGFALLLDCG